MSVPELRHDAASGIIYMHWTDPAKVKGERGRSRRLSTGAREMVAAETFLAKWMLFEQEQPAGEKVYTVGELWAIYDEKHVEKLMSAANIRGVWQNLDQHFGALAVSQVSQDSVDAYELKRQKGRIGRPAKSSTVRKELLTLMACFHWCSDIKKKRKYLAREHVPSFDMPAEAKPRDRWLRTPEIQKLLEAAEAVSAKLGNRMSRGERFVWLALETAARDEAIRQLTWDRVDFEQWTIDYRMPGRPETKKRRTVVPVSKALRGPLLRMHEERLSDDGFILDSDTRLWKSVKTIAKAAGIAGVSAHVLRHTAATHMARRGVPLWIISKILGNTLAMVEKVYAKHCPDDLRTAVDAISGSYSVLGSDLRAGGAQDVVST